MGAAVEKRPLRGHIGWGLLTLLAAAMMFSGIGPVELAGDMLLALCLLKAGLKVHGHVIGGGPRRRLRFGSSNQSENPPPGDPPQAR